MMFTVIYIYGFICHCALDHACHTYVEQKIMARGDVKYIFFIDFSGYCTRFN